MSTTGFDNVLNDVCKFIASCCTCCRTETIEKDLEKQTENMLQESTPSSSNDNYNDCNSPMTLAAYAELTRKRSNNSMMLQE